MQTGHRIRFGRWEAEALLINLICTKIFLYFNRMTVEDAGNAGWLMTIFVCLVVLLVYSLLTWLYKNSKAKIYWISLKLQEGGSLKLSPDLYLEERWHLWRHHDAEIFRRFKDHILPTSPLSYVMFFYGRDGNSRFSGSSRSSATLR